MASAQQDDSENVKGAEIDDTEASKSSKNEEATENIDHQENSSENVGEEEGKGNAQGDDIENEAKAVDDSSQKNETEAEKVLPTDDGNKLSGLTDDKVVVTREDLKEVFQKFGIVKVFYRLSISDILFLYIVWTYEENEKKKKDRNFYC